MKTLVRPQSARFRPKPEEIYWKEDTAEEAAGRARAERVLYELIEDVNKHEALDCPVILALVDMDDEDVNISCQQRRLTKNDRKRWVYVIETSMTWIGAATDGQLRAVFAHELGHAALGHCPKDDPSPKQLWEARKKKVKTRVAKLKMVPGLITVLLFAPKPVVLAILLGLAALGAGMILYKLGGTLIDAWTDRVEETAADEFCLRFANGEDLVADLARCHYTRWDHIRTWMLYPLNSHPPLRIRARAMGVGMASG